MTTNYTFTPEVIKLRSLGYHTMYGCRFDGSVAFIRVSYRHTVTAEFSTLVVHPDGKHTTHSGHPRSNGVTSKNNWSIDPEMKNANWND